MRRKDRARRRVLALGLAVAVHFAFVAGLLVGARFERPSKETPTMTVAIVDMPKPKRLSDPRPSPPPAAEQRKYDMVDASLVEAERAAGTSGAAATVGEGAALAAAPFGQGLRSGLRRRERCYMAQQTEVEKADCERMMAEFRLKSRREAQDGDFALATQRKEAIVSYRKSYRGDDFPGLRCAFGHDCKPLPAGRP